MSLREELIEKIHELASEQWGNVAMGFVTPSPEDLTFGNTGRRLNACFLYADIHGSTKMVDELQATLAAEYYKAFLHCAAKVIKRNAGEVIAYDGDRIMAIFLGNDRADQAINTAMQLHFAVLEIVNPGFAAVYGTLHRPLQHTVGIDSGEVLASKIGVRIDSDLVWVGSPANYAAKLNSFHGLDPQYPTRVTQEVFAVLNPTSLFGSNGEKMWEGPYTDVGERKHYRSRFIKRFD
jgi:class 3 adenylate cyclase